MPRDVKSNQINDMQNEMHYNLNMLKKSSQGFTLVELLVVVLILGVLSGVVLAVLNSSGIQQKARDSQRKSDLKIVQSALELYFADNRMYPDNRLSWIPAHNIPGITSYVNPVPTDPKPFGTTNAACSATSSGYLYRSNSSSPYGRAYVLSARMELSASASDGACNTLSNCNTGLIGGCNCAAPCYAVQNPN